MKRDTRFFNLPPWWILSNILLHFMNMLKCIYRWPFYFYIELYKILPSTAFNCIRMDSWLWLASYLQQSTLMFKQRVAHALRSFQRKDGRSRKPSHNWVTECRFILADGEYNVSHVLPSADDMYEMLWRPGLWALTANWRKGRRERANKRQIAMKTKWDPFRLCLLQKMGGKLRHARRKVKEMKNGENFRTRRNNSGF